MGWKLIDEATGSGPNHTREPKVHQPDPADSGRAMCGRILDLAAPTLVARPPSVPRCRKCREQVRKCREQVHAARKKRQKEIEAIAGPSRSTKKKSRKAQLSQEQQIARQRRASRAAQRAEAADRMDRQREQSSSIRTVSGGLPTLGRRHR
jgi:ATPase subunit of ABC transporter with duplicated ATPase domains